ncbi:MAG: CHAT domain-containing protein, partial [Bryobacteraceae bacterium]
CAHATTQYRSAMEFYLRARDISGKSGDTESAIALSVNLAGLYNRMGNLPAAAEAIKDAFAAVSSDSLGDRSGLLMTAAVISSRQGDFPRAVSLLRTCINHAQLRGDLRSSATAWNQLGFEYLQKGNLGAAERALTESFRLRKMTGSKELATSYRNLGNLRLAQGDKQGALRMLDEGIAFASKTRSHVPAWSLYYNRANARRAAGDLPGAFSDLETALDLARRWRVQVVPTDSFRTGTDVGLERIYADYISAGMELHSRTNDVSYARGMFVAAQASRALSLREQLKLNEKLPPEYYEKLSRLRTAEIAALRHPKGKGSEEVEDLRLQLIEMETRYGVDTGAEEENSHRKNENSSLGNPLPALQRALNPEEALISFHLGKERSFVWAVTRDSFEVHQLAARSGLAERIRNAKTAIMTGAPEFVENSERAYSSLFGSLSPAVAEKTEWLLVLDDALFELPFAALVTGSAGSRPQYLIERHSLRVLPAAAMLESRSSKSKKGAFLGIGDPIYNPADSRWRARAESTGASWFRLSSLLNFGGNQEDGSDDLELARLAGSGREVVNCSREWRSGEPPVLLLGRDTGRGRILDALSNRPAVVHFAAHVVQKPGAPELSLIGIGLNNAGQPDYLTPTELASYRFDLGLVVLSGCSSGAGAVRPGVGLMGLTRAWLLAGAQAVTAAQWPIVDDSGELFSHFYQSLASGKEALTSAAAAHALRAAQVQMLQSGGWRAQPRYWAAFFVAGKD